LFPEADPESFVFCADILCAKLQYQKLAQEEAHQKALAIWDIVAALIIEAKARGYNMESDWGKLSARYPHFKYIHELGDDLKSNLEKLISKQ
jgi:hypothetical protein